MDDKEFTAILRQHAALLARIAASYEAQPAARDDLLQDIALALWKAVPRWRGEASLKTFVARVAHNRGATHVGKATRHRCNEPWDGTIADDSNNPQAHAQGAQRQQRLYAAVRQLPLSLRQPVTLAMEGFLQREIADALGITSNNVAVRLHRARKALKISLGEAP